MPFTIPMVGANPSAAPLPASSSSVRPNSTTRTKPGSTSGVQSRCHRHLHCLRCFALTDAAGNYTADVAFVSGEYGWVHSTTSRCNRPQPTDSLRLLQELRLLGFLRTAAKRELYVRS